MIALAVDKAVDHELAYYFLRLSGTLFLCGAAADIWFPVPIVYFEGVYLGLTEEINAVTADARLQHICNGICACAYCGQCFLSSHPFGAFCRVITQLAVQHLFLLGEH